MEDFTQGKLVRQAGQGRPLKHAWRKGGGGTGKVVKHEDNHDHTVEDKEKEF